MAHHAMFEERFISCVELGLGEVKKVLDTTREVVKATPDVEHTYADKFQLAEFVTNLAVNAARGGLEEVGLSDAKLEAILDAAGGAKTLTLGFAATETCTFDKKESREVKSKTAFVTETKKATGTTTEKSYAVTTVDEWFWHVAIAFEVYVYAGADPTADGAKVVLRAGERSTRVKTAHEGEPAPKKRIVDAKEVEVTHLLRLMAAGGRCFAIDRAAASCRTPRRNGDVEKVLAAMKALREWCYAVHMYFDDSVFDRDPDETLRYNAERAVAGVFVPVLPMFEKAPARVAGKTSPAVVPAADMDTLLREARRQLAARLASFAAQFPKKKGLLTVPDTQLCGALMWTASVTEQHCEAVLHVEGMLRDQLVSAIGKRVQPHDFDEYMTYHNRKLFAEAFAPKAFCHAVRRPMHNPEGLVSIETDGRPIATLARRIPEHPERTFKFALNAAATLTFTGDTYVHSYVAHRFSNQHTGTLDLFARAKQFGSYVVVLGHIGGADLFLPKHAMLVQNKDEFQIPLDLEAIPTPKEFKDAIASLSPEQQRFARAYRAMQLEATLFGVCVIQVKPQLERVLNLPAGALTKEMKLTSDLLDLFVEYQIASDLLAYQEDACVDAELVAVTGAEKVAAVRAHVGGICEMLNVVRKSEADLAEIERRKRDLEEGRARLEAERREVLQLRDEVQCMREDAERMMRDAHRAQAELTAQREMHYAQELAAQPECYSQATPAPEPAYSCSAAIPMSCDVAFSALMPDVCMARTEVVREAPEPQATQQQQQQQADGSSPTSTPAASFDVSAIPRVLDARYEALDTDAAVRPTLIKVGERWQKRFQKNLLSRPQEACVSGEGLRQEKGKAFDLLDALTRSGALPVSGAELHVVIAATHCFDKTLMNTVVQDNVNPIEKVERTALIAATTIHDCAPDALLCPAQAARIKERNPQLYVE